MGAREYDIHIEQGSDWAYQWPVTDGADPIDLTLAGWSLKGQVRSRDSSETVLHEWSVANGNAVLESGSFTLTVPAAESSAWTWKKGVYDIELTHPDGAITRVLQGKVTVDFEVTR